MFQLNEFAARLKAIRMELGLSQDALAKKLNVSRVALSYYENGQRTPDIEFLYNLQQVTGYPFEYLMCVSEAKETENVSASQQIGLNDAALELVEENAARINAIATYTPLALQVFLLSFHAYISGNAFTILPDETGHITADSVLEWMDAYIGFDEALHEAVNVQLDTAKAIGYARLSKEARSILHDILNTIENFLQSSLSPSSTNNTFLEGTPLRKDGTPLFKSSFSRLVKSIKQIDESYRKLNIPSET